MLTCPRLPFKILLLLIYFAAVLLPAETDQQNAGKEQKDAGYKFVEAGQYKIVDEAEVQMIQRTHGRKLLVVNYWATWCVPCIKEIPYFNAAFKKYRDQGVMIVGFSSDFVSQAETNCMVPSASRFAVSITRSFMFGAYSLSSVIGANVRAKNGELPGM